MAFEDVAGLIELTFVYSVVLGFCIWQLVSIRRQLKRDREAQAPRAEGEDPRT